jgi:hypothetical protein
LAAMMSPAVFMLHLRWAAFKNINPINTICQLGYKGGHD